METDRREFLIRREDFAKVKADVDAHELRLQEEEEALKVAREKVEHDHIWIDVKRKRFTRN